ncbi:hypothetical protein P7C70_g2248, partial [Phenoliferia sp. Uapishka_3]
MSLLRTTLYSTASSSVAHITKSGVSSRFFSASTFLSRHPPPPRAVGLQNPAPCAFAPKILKAKAVEVVKPVEIQHQSFIFFTKPAEREQILLTTLNASGLPTFASMADSSDAPHGASYLHPFAGIF